MKINLKESIAGLKQDGKHTPKSIIFIFMLVVICVEVGIDSSKEAENSAIYYEEFKI